MYENGMLLVYIKMCFLQDWLDQKAQDGAKRREEKRKERERNAANRKKGVCHRVILSS